MLTRPSLSTQYFYFKRRLIIDADNHELPLSSKPDDLIMIVKTQLRENPASDVAERFFVEAQKVPHQCSPVLLTIAERLAEDVYLHDQPLELLERFCQRVIASAHRDSLLLKPADCYRKWEKILHFLAQLHFEDARDLWRELMLSQTLPYSELDTPAWVDGYTLEADDEGPDFFNPRSDAGMEPEGPLYEYLADKLGYTPEMYRQFLAAQEGFNSEADEEEEFYDEHDLKTGVLEEMAADERRPSFEEFQLAIEPEFLAAKKVFDAAYQTVTDKRIAQLYEHIAHELGGEPDRERVCQLYTSGEKSDPLFRRFSNQIWELRKGRAEEARQLFRTSREAKAFLQALREQALEGVDPSQIATAYSALSKTKTGFLPADQYRKYRQELLTEAIARANELALENDLSAYRAQKGYIQYLKEYLAEITHDEKPECFSIPLRSSASTLYTNLGEYILDRSDDVVDEFRDSLGETLETDFKTIEDFSERTIEDYVKTLSKDGSDPKSHPAFIRAYFKAATEAKNVYSVDSDGNYTNACLAAGWEAWRDHVNPYAAGEYRRAIHEGKTQKQAWDVFRAACRTRIVGLSSEGAALSNGRRVNYAILLIKIKREELYLPRHEALRLLQALKTNRWGSKELLEVLNAKVQDSLDQALA